MFGQLCTHYYHMSAEAYDIMGPMMSSLQQAMWTMTSPFKPVDVAIFLHKNKLVHVKNTTCTHIVSD